MPYYLVKANDVYSRKIIKSSSMVSAISRLRDEKEFDLNNLEAIEFLYDDIEHPVREIREVIRSLFDDIEYLASVGWYAVENQQGARELGVISKVISEKAKKALDICRGLEDFNHAGFSKELK